MQERTGQCRKEQDNTGKNRTIQERIGQHRKEQDNTGKNRTKQERTGQTCYLVVG
jgi:hypothetical protein